MMSVFNVTDFTDNACINIYPIGEDFVAASESDVVLSFDPETLETKDRVSGRFSIIVLHCVSGLKAPRSVYIM